MWFVGGDGACAVQPALMVTVWCVRILWQWARLDDDSVDTLNHCAHLPDDACVRACAHCITVNATTVIHFAWLN